MASRFLAKVGCRMLSIGLLVLIMAVDKGEPSVEIATFDNRFRGDFERLNREWIEAFFVLEDADRAVFADPEHIIVSRGGQIFFVLENDQVRGTCAVLRRDGETYELAKMAVTPSARGKGFGDLLMQAAIEFARSAGAREIVLSSNTRLGPAIRLYRKYGFETVPLAADERYHRVDIMMRLDLTDPTA